VGKVLSFEPQVGKVKTGLTSGGFTVIIPKNFLYQVGASLSHTSV